MLNKVVNGLGIRPRSTIPMRRLHPAEDAIAPRIDEAQEQDEHEDAHLDETEAGVALELRGPREDEHGLDVEDHEHQGEHVVADLALRPAVTNRVDTALVRGRLVGRRLHRPDEGGDAEQQPAEEQGDRPEPDDVEVVAQEVRHRRRRYYSSTTGLQTIDLDARRSERQSADQTLSGATHGAMPTAIEAIVARVPAWAGRSPVVRPLPGHAREQVVAVAVDGEEYVVRRMSDTELLGLRPANAVAATRRAAELGVGPLLAGVVDRHTLITPL